VRGGAPPIAPGHEAPAPPPAVPRRVLPAVHRRRARTPASGLPPWPLEPRRALPAPPPPAPPSSRTNTSTPTPSHNTGRAVQLRLLRPGVRGGRGGAGLPGQRNTRGWRRVPGARRRAGAGCCAGAAGRAGAGVRGAAQRPATGPAAGVCFRRGGGWVLLGGMRHRWGCFGAPRAHPAQLRPRALPCRRRRRRGASLRRCAQVRAGGCGWRRWWRRTRHRGAEESLKNEAGAEVRGTTHTSCGHSSPDDACYL
jgi:hypothetical protein